MKNFLDHRCYISKISRSAITALMIAIIVMSIDACQEMRPPNRIMHVLMKSSVGSFAQIYFDVGKGLNEKDSTVVNVSKSNKFQLLQFQLPNDPIYYLRFDPIKIEGIFEIKYVKIVDDTLQTIQRIDLHSIKALQQIRVFKIKKHSVVGVTTKNANDPMLYFKTDYPIRNSRIDFVSDYFKTVPKKAAMIFILSFAALLFEFF